MNVSQLKRTVLLLKYIGEGRLRFCVYNGFARAFIRDCLSSKGENHLRRSDIHCCDHTPSPCSRYNMKKEESQILSSKGKREGSRLPLAAPVPTSCGMSMFTSPSQTARPVHPSRSATSSGVTKPCVARFANTICTAPVRIFPHVGSSATLALALAAAARWFSTYVSISNVCRLGCLSSRVAMTSLLRSSKRRD